MTTDRRRFLSRLTLGGMALGTLPASLQAATTSGALGTGGAAGASSTMRELRDHLSQPEAPTFDATWTARLTGKHKAVFDVPEIEGGSGVWRAGLWRDHYRDVLKAEPADLSPVLVIRHAAIPLVMKQEFWDEYEIGKSREVKHPMTDEPTDRNPVLSNPDDKSLPPMFSALTLDAQMRNGTIVLGCDMAFGQMVGMVRRKHSVDGAEARKRAIAMMLPGVILQPNGIFGVTLAQEFGCSFVAAA